MLHCEVFLYTVELQWLELFEPLEFYCIEKTSKFETAVVNEPSVFESNTDGSFTTAVSNSFLSPWEKSHSCRFGTIEGDFLQYIENGILCVLT